MKSLRRLAIPLAGLWLSFSLGGCGRWKNPATDSSDPYPRARPARQSVPDNARADNDKFYNEMLAYRYATRMAYNSRRFDELERLADEARSTKARFGDGAWKIGQFYDSFGLWATEPDGMWELHDSIHKAWVAARPASITARVAQMDFLVEYAWHARGNGFAGSVTPSGWQLFGERLKLAHQALDESKNLEAKDPEWWAMGLRLGLGEGWSRADYDKFYAAGKAFEPMLWTYDTLRSNYLATKWYGQPGDWEAAAEEAAAAPDGLGAEIYARCVWSQSANYDDIFKESKANWAKTQEGYELMLGRYPGSMEVASAYCKLACIAGDRLTAKKLFDLLGDSAFSSFWVNQENLRRDRTWANAPD